MRLLMVVLSAFVLAACSRHEPDERYRPTFSNEPILEQYQEYIFGIHPLHNPKRLHEVFGPIINHLNDSMDGVKFRLEASRNYDSFDKKLYGRKFHFALPNPYQTVNSFEHGYEVFGKMADDDNFRGIIIVRRNSGIEKVTDLTGLSMSFPAPTALAATMLPQYYLQTHGLDVMTELDIRYVGSQESAIMNVMRGDTQAGATWPPPWQALLKERPELNEELKVIWQTQSLPNNSLVVRDDVNESVLNKVKQAFLTLHRDEDGVQWLAKMELSHFEPATNDTYQPVVDFIKQFSRTVRPIKPISVDE